MENVLLIDFGSTYTKVIAVEVSKPRLLGYASAFTTISSDVNEGLESALAELKSQTGIAKYHKRLACSSAAGGLRMIASGLAPELTAKAASLATVGAGAKIVGLYNHELTEEDITDIYAASPDILLLTGGTDGGNKKCIIHNAKMLAGTPGDFPVIIAGNRNSSREVMQILADRRVYACENVMPAVGTLNMEPARQLIRDIFLERIVHAKGLSGVLMPTPAAMLTAAELLARDVGELIAVDVGGATTDVYSIAGGEPHSSNVIYKGLPEPYAKRTVEGDIGMRYSAMGIAEAAGISRIAELAGMHEDIVLKDIEYLTKNTSTLPETMDQRALDFALAALAVETATLRHAGSLEETYTSSGRVFIQNGKDLTGVQTVVLTGGALINNGRQSELAGHVLYNGMKPQSLRPKKVKTLIDKHYILAAMGLLCGYAPEAAMKIMKSNIL